MTQTKIDNTIVDVIYDDNTIHHVLAPNTEGVRGVPVGQHIIRESIQKAKGYLNYYGFDLQKIDEYIMELKRESDEAQIKIE